MAVKKQKPGRAGHRIAAVHTRSPTTTETERASRRTKRSKTAKPRQSKGQRPGVQGRAPGPGLTTATPPGKPLAPLADVVAAHDRAVIPAARELAEHVERRAPGMPEAAGVAVSWAMLSSLAVFAILAFTTGYTPFRLHRSDSTRRANNLPSTSSDKPRHLQTRNRPIPPASRADWRHGGA